MSDFLPPGKVCPDRGLAKSEAEFGRNKRRADGLAQYCKECFRRRSKASYRKRMAERGKRVRVRPEVRRGTDGRFEVVVVRPRRDEPAIDPGWEIGQIGGHDLAVLHTFARDDSGDPWEFDVDVAEPGPVEPRFPVLDLSDLPDAPRPTGPPHPAEYALL